MIRRAVGFVIHPPIGGPVRRIFSITLALAFFATVPTYAGGDAAEYGDGVTLEEAVAVETLLGSPDDYLGKTVRVDGVITGVCKKRGCWMQVTNPETGNGVRIKVDDGVIVFPYTAMGKKASAEGVFDAITLTPEQVAAETKWIIETCAPAGGYLFCTGEMTPRDTPEENIRAMVKALRETKT